VGRYQKTLDQLGLTDKVNTEIFKDKHDLLFIVVLSASNALSTSSFTILEISVIACSATIRLTESSERRLISDVMIFVVVFFVQASGSPTRRGGHTQTQRKREERFFVGKTKRSQVTS